VKQSRRQFLAQTVCVAASAPVYTATAAGGTPANDRITLGIIGTGCMGRGHVRVCLGNPSVQVLAVCDVDKPRRDNARRTVDKTYADARAKGTYRGCEAYNDYRELIARDDLDGVVIVTPDHWHALAAVDAARAGKDVYCEKPVTLTIKEGRRLVEVVRQYARVFQTGTQYRSMYRTRRVIDFVRGGGLGKIHSVFTIWGKVGNPAGKPAYYPQDPALRAEAVPDGLDWNLWVGPASWRPYNSRYHRNPIPGVVPWVFCNAFGAGAVTSYHSHAADVIQYALGVERSGPVEIIHPSSGEFPTLTCRYANGTLLHLVDNWGKVKSVYGAVPSSARLAGNFGGLFVGERGWVTSMYGGGPFQGAPDEIFKEMGLKSREVAHANNHHANWFDCIRTRGRPSTDEEIGHRSASLGHLTNLAFELGRSLKWDPGKEAFVGDAQANRLLSRAMREPWRM
jgi:hypothetical protein